MRIITFTLLFLCLNTLLIAQTLIEGVVTEKNGTPIIGANVFLKNAFDGASTDLEGRFSFQTFLTKEQTLVVSYLGYNDQEQLLQLDGKTLQLTVELKPNAATLQAVTITAGTFEAGDEKKTEVLNSIDIATTAGATADIAGAMNTLPGTQRVGETGQLFVRGGAAYETRTFIDGMYVQSPYNSSASNIPARGRFSPFLFKGMSFSTGGYSAEYGQALSSALILNTQDLAEETVTGLSFMTIGGGVSRTQAMENTSIAVSIDYANLGPYMGLAPQNLDWLEAPETRSGQLILRQKTSSTGLLKFYAMGSRSQFKLMYPDTEDIHQTSPLRLVNDNYFSQATYQEVFGDKWSIKAGIGFTADQNEMGSKFSLNQAEQTYQTRATISFQANDHLRLKTGGVYLLNRFDERYIDPQNEPFNTKYNNHYSAGFLEADIYFSKKLVARLGNRVEHASLLNTYKWSPRFSLAYQLNDHEQFSLALGQFYQTPEREHFRYTRTLDFEKANHYILNYQRIKDNRTFRVEAYQKTYQQLVKFDEASPWLANNSGKGYARGVDVFFRDRKSFKYGDYWLSYSYLDTKRDYRDFPVAATPHFASKHNFSAVYKYWIADWNSTMGVTYSYGSPRPYNDPNATQFNAGRTKAYNDLSVNFSYLTNLWGQFTILHLSATNILNFDNTFGHQYSNQTNEKGIYESIPIKPASNQFFFVGLFVSIGQQHEVTKDDL